jgi:cytochrome c-type protein NapB
MSASGHKGQGLPARWLHVGAVVAVTVAATGYFAGTRPPSAVERPSVAVPGGPAERAPSYSELRELRRGPNAHMYEGAIAALEEAPFPVKALPVASAAERTKAVTGRQAHRAYDGAPPTIPHEIDPRGVPGCLACHGQGMKLGARTAPRISHAPYQSCTQCHVVEDSPRPLAAYPDVPANRFVGLVSAGSGARAWPGAPPTLPHPTHMRTECASCHGPGGQPGLRTSHPERQNCVQCHGASASLDQRVAEGAHP